MLLQSRFYCTQYVSRNFSLQLQTLMNLRIMSNYLTDGTPGNPNWHAWVHHYRGTIDLQTLYRPYTANQTCLSSD